MACPAAPPSHQKLAAELSRTVLAAVPGTAIAARSQSVSDPYTTIRAGQEGTNADRRVRLRGRVRWLTSSGAA